MKIKIPNKKQHKHCIDETSMLKEIWVKFIDVQEQLIRSRITPISVIPESSKVIGDKLQICIEENDTAKGIVNEVSRVFKLPIESISLDEGFINVDESAYCVNEDISYLSNNAEKHFIKLSALPIIDGTIKRIDTPYDNIESKLRDLGADFSFDKKSRLQITLPSLKSINEQRFSDQFDFHLPDLANIILTIRPNPIYFLKKEYPHINFKHKTIA